MIHSLAVCSVTLIAIAQNDDADDCHYSNLLNLVFNAMVLLVGIEEVINMKNVEKFKKEIKVEGIIFFPLVKLIYYILLIIKHSVFANKNSVAQYNKCLNISINISYKTELFVYTCSFKKVEFSHSFLDYLSF